MSALTELVQVIVPGGIVGTLLLVAQAYKSYKESRESKEETVLQRWQRLTREAEEDKLEAVEESEYQMKVADYWRSRCADVEYRLGIKGGESPPLAAFPQRHPERKGRRREQREASEEEERRSNSGRVT